MRAWPFGIASNLVRRHWRSEERRLRALTREAAAPATPLDPVLLATAAAVVVGLAGTALVVSNRDTAVAPSDAADATAPAATEPFDNAPTDAEADPNVEANSTPSGQVDLAAGTKFAVAEYLPVGWGLDSMEAMATGVAVRQHTVGIAG